MGSRSEYPPGRVPLRALALSLGALTVPVAGALFFGQSLAQYRSLLYLLALVPAFLLAYYHGWRGVSVALAVGMAVLSLALVAGPLLGTEMHDWPLFLFVVSPYIAIALGAGWGSDVLREVTERKRGEAALRRLEKALETMQLGVTITDAEGRIIYGNPAEADMHGYTVHELIGKDVGIYTSSERRRPLTSAQFNALGNWTRESVNVRKDGSTFPVHLTSDVVVDASGETVGVVTTCEDISERRALETQLRQAQKMEAVGQLTGGIAHDFNNLLTVIRANADLVASALPPELADARADIEELQTAAGRGTKLIKKLLGFSRRATLELKPVDLAQLLSELSGMLRRVLSESIELQFVADRSEATVLADAGAVEQIVLNLATNARDAMPAGGILRFEVERTWLDEGYHATHPWCAPGEYVCLTVSDTGIGMDAETKERIFEPFFTTKAPGVGSGLGMAMIYGLVKQHGGFMQVYSELGQGTAVKICLPVVSREAEAPAPTVAPEAVPGGSQTILVVEDEQAIRRATRRVLESRGYRVLLAADGEEGLEAFREHETEIELVIADLVMPKLGGRQLYQALRQAHKTVNVMFTSGYAARDLQESAALEADVPFLHKPWTVTDLLVRVREVLDKDRSASQVSPPPGHRGTG